MVKVRLVGVELGLVRVKLRFVGVQLPLSVPFPTKHEAEAETIPPLLERLLLREGRKRDAAADTGAWLLEELLLTGGSEDTPESDTGS